MDIDWAHALATVLVLAVTLYTTQRTGALDGKSKVQRALIIAPIVFVVILIFNLLWPYGS